MPEADSPLANFSLRESRNLKVAATQFAIRLGWSGKRK